MSDKGKVFDRIWLQTCGNSMSEWYGEITWCQDKVNDDDVEYFRADIVESQRRELAAAKESADYAWRNTNTIEKARQEEMAKRDELLAALSPLITSRMGAEQIREGIQRAIAKVKEI
jgi:hypothetical protein